MQPILLIDLKLLENVKQKKSCSAFKITRWHVNKDMLMSDKDSPRQPSVGVYKWWDGRPLSLGPTFHFQLWRAEVLSVWQSEGCVVRFYSNAPVLLVNQHLLLSPGRPTVTHDRCHLYMMSKRSPPHTNTPTHTQDPDSSSFFLLPEWSFFLLTLPNKLNRHVF